MGLTNTQTAALVFACTLLIGLVGWLIRRMISQNDKVIAEVKAANLKANDDNEQKVIRLWTKIETMEALHKSKDESLADLSSESETQDKAITELKTDLKSNTDKIASNYGFLQRLDERSQKRSI